MTSKEIIKQIIVKLEDDLQHYTMVDKDKVKAKYIELELKEYKQVLKDLDRLEKLEKENQVLREKVNHFKNVKNRYRRNEKFVEKENVKLKKAMRIIIDKGVNELFLKPTRTSNEYNTIMRHLEYFDELTQEEYELLKEVLEDDK